MNEQMQKTLADLIEKTISSTESVVEFGKQEIPLVVEQLLMWKLSEAIFTAVICFCLIFAFFWFLRKNYKTCNQNESDTMLFKYNFSVEPSSAMPHTHLSVVSLQ